MDQKITLRYPIRLLSSTVTADRYHVYIRTNVQCATIRSALCLPGNKIIHFCHCIVEKAIIRTTTWNVTLNTMIIDDNNDDGRI